MTATTKTMRDMTQRASGLGRACIYAGSVEKAWLTQPSRMGGFPGPGHEGAYRTAKIVMIGP